MAHGPGRSQPDALERARNGDPDAFAQLYREHAGRVYALCLRLTGESSEAADLTQDAFVRAWERLPGFRGDAAFGTWLHRIAVNVVLQRQRTDRRRIARIEPCEDPETLGTATPPVPIDLRHDLEQAIGTLPAAMRVAFVLHDVEGYDYAEIHAMTGTSEVALRSQLHRARRRLMELLG